MYKYGMRLRPLGIGCQPDGHTKYTQSDKRQTGFYGYLEYEDPLTDEEVKKFELESLNKPTSRIKTFKQWERSEKDLVDFVKPFEQVDEELYLHMGGVVSPQYCSSEFLQVGEAEDEKGGVFFYMTFSHINGKYFYLGSLPEFKQ